MEEIAESFDIRGLNLEEMEGKHILITGATGLIGRSLVELMLNWNKSSSCPIKITILVRNREKAERIFEDFSKDNLQYCVSDICELKPVDMNVNFIIHCASQTSSRVFVDEPVETTLIAIEGTRKILEFAKSNPVSSFVYLSSMEVYGTPATDEKITEDYSTNLDSMKVRSCYPESKRMCENLCVSYAVEYGIPIKVIRLTQTFGLGVEYNDGRVFAEFARCVIEERPIILKTKGETKRCYLHIEDAVSAIVTVLLHGKTGEAYNVANEETYCSIYEMACLVAQYCSKDKIQVIVQEDVDISKLGYAPTLKMNLDTQKVRALGWSAKYTLIQTYQSMISYMKKCRKSDGHEWNKII